jgi:23S rRNA 5-hydroxycytidine C2501 synthase
MTNATGFEQLNRFSSAILHNSHYLADMGTGRNIELLAPARDLECGIAAVNHGADAVYMGAPRFGARAAAGNSLEDIAAVIAYAHKYWARVYVTLNTLLFDHELEDAHSLITRMYEAGADALIFQDMGLMELDLPPIPLFASTQTHNYDLAKIQFLEGVGIQRVILARELSAKQIAAIRAKTTIELEAFVHGALCVSFSGQCYFSEVVKGRSANRGECAQMCRLPYTLIDGRGNILAQNKHLLSLKDLNLSDYLSELMAAGVTSFKIEGRLKDVQYVKNITAFYRARLDSLMAQQPSLRPSSSGTTSFTFVPDPARSFNRGFTQYFFTRRTQEMVSLRTPKSLGASLGRVRSVSTGSFTVASKENLHNGDGICFFNGNDELQGVNINRVEGDNIFPNSMDGIQPGMVLYRNHDHEFARQLRGKTGNRRIGVGFSFEETDDGFVLLATDEDGISVRSTIVHPKEPATNPERALNTIRTQMAKSGETVFALNDLQYKPDTVFFLPVALLNGLRRSCLEALEAERAKRFPRREYKLVPNSIPHPATTLDQYANVTNDKAMVFYRRHAVKEIAKGVELQDSNAGTSLMTTRYCLKYQFDLCDGERSTAEGLFLSDGKHRFRLEFDCGNCLMKVVSLEEEK